MTRLTRQQLCITQQPVLAVAPGWLCTSCVCLRYVGPGAKQVQALQDLGQAAPLEGEDMSHLKNRLAAGAAEALELQLR